MIASFDPAILLQALRARTAVAPPADAVPVLVNGRSCGWASPAAARALAGHPAVRGGPGALTLSAAPEAMADVARTLHEAGVLNGWRGECLDVTDDQGQVLSHIERAAMRPLGLRTRAVHLNAFSHDGHVWIARRASHKTTDPGLWDTLVGGLVATGESPDVALVRESAEEAGLAPSDLSGGRIVGEFVVSRHVPEGYQVEAVSVTDCVLPAGCTPANQDGEVDLIRCVPLADVWPMIAQGQFTTEAALSLLISWEASGRRDVAG